MLISKSEFLMFLKHPAWLWLKKYDSKKLPLPNEAMQALFDEGELFESYAEKCFDGAVKLGYKNGKEFSASKYYALPENTIAEIKKGTKVILQGRLEVDGITSVFDVLEKVDEKTFDLYEIKSSTKVKDPDHILDLAFQTTVLEKSGFKARNIYVLHVNNKYIRKGEVDPASISTKSDVTEEVRESLLEVEAQIEKAKEVLKLKTCPPLSPRFVNGGSDVMEEWLKIFEIIQGKLPKYSAYKLSTIDSQTVGWLEDNGIELLEQIPLDAPILNEKQLRQVGAIKSGEQHIDREAIVDFFNQLKFPVYFLDYETFAGVIPAFDGYRPYQQVPFQYSLHILPAPNAELIHKEYLHTENTDPVPTLVESLYNHFGAEGSVISWYMTFEKTRNAEMAKAHPKYEKFLLGVNDRMIDLMTPFSKGWFVDKDFFGRASIKWVLPALLPLSYKELEKKYGIANGTQAQRFWMETVLQGKHAAKKDLIFEGLLEYCGLDTYAMYAIYDYLLKRIEEPEQGRLLTLEVNQ